MEPALNCSHLDTELDPQGALGVLQELCRVSKAQDVAHISVAVQGVLGFLLTCGLLLSTFFFIFTIRFRKNRIVKMSSPNLNLVLVLGSVLTYISAFMFAAQGRAVSMETVIQARLSLLYIGLSLVFGPLLGKSWRLYRVFTHRAPHKRVIIKDIALLGLEAALLFMDALLLLSWVLSDPVTCVLNVTAGIKAGDRATSCEVTRAHFCSSKHTEFWVVLLMGIKGMFLIYGSYLAGLTKNISTPPVNQSLVIMVGSSLVIAASGVCLVVSHVFYTWPSLVYGVTAGSVLLCTTTITCLVFIPQLLQWKHFEDEPSQTNTQMAKYFNSPCKSMRSMYSEEQIYHLLGENTSMRRLLTEKNAVIESLQEQVTNAKEKLVELLRSECSVEITQVSAISNSTLTINQLRVTTDETTAESRRPSTNQRPSTDTVEDRRPSTNQRPSTDTVEGRRPSTNQRPSTDTVEGKRPSTNQRPSTNTVEGRRPSTNQRPSTNTVESRRPSTNQRPSPATVESRRPSTINPEGRPPSTGDLDRDTNQSMVVHTTETELAEDVTPPDEDSADLYEVVLPSPEGKQEPDPAAMSRTVSFVDDGAKEFIERPVDGPHEAWEQLSRKVNYVSTEKLQEILRELSVETLSGCAQGSPRRQRRSSHSVQREPVKLPSEGFTNVCISLSPYIARRRRGYGRRSMLPSSQLPRAPFPPPRLIGARDRHYGNHPRDETDGANHTSIPMKNVDLCGQEKTGLWITKLSEEPECLQESCPTTPWSLQGAAALRPQTLRPQTLCSESDSSSSEETFCYCHRPYCEMCSPPTCDSSDSCNTDTESAEQLHVWPGPHRTRRSVINFNDDLTPTYV